MLRKCLTDCGKDILDILSEKQICLDGKKLRGENPQSRGNKGLYIVNAWVAENKLCIGQERVSEKSDAAVELKLKLFQSSSKRLI